LQDRNEKNKKVMPKQIDVAKLERIREAAVSLISRNGSTNASVALIAKEAGVSTGYLYRHYAGKEELLNDLLDRILTRISDRIAVLAESNGSLEEAVAAFIGYLFQTVREQPDHVRFCLNLQNDLSCPISRQITDRIKSLCEEILRQGKEAGSIDAKITAEDLYIILLCMPLQYIGVRLRGVFGTFTCNDEEIRHVSERCLSAIKS